MTSTRDLAAFQLDDALIRERPRLVGLCASLVRNRDVAEDLAQEVLYEAWKSQYDLRDKSRSAEWLAGIARNVCLRWLQRERRDVAHRARLPEALHDSEDASASAGASLDLLADDFELEVEFERQELATLLDRALGLLPPTTRAVLVGHYIEGAPHALLAQRLGLGEGAVKVRLHRGNLALRRALLREEFVDTARAYGLARAAGDTWEETRLWCTFCGQRRLVGRFVRDDGPGEFRLRCPGCFASRGLVYHDSDAALLGGVVRYKSAVTRISTWANHYFREALSRGVVPCRRCGSPATLTIGQDTSSERQALEVSDPLGNVRTLIVTCERCGLQNVQSHAGLILASPQGQAFWRAHPRIRLLPERQVETQGRAALVTTFASVTDGARLAVVSARDTYEALSAQPRATDIGAIERTL